MSGRRQPSARPSNRLAMGTRPDTEAARCQLAMIEPRSLVEQPQQRRQVDCEPPLVRAPARSKSARGEIVPPWCDRTRDWLDDEDPCSGNGGSQQSIFDIGPYVRR